MNVLLTSVNYKGHFFKLEFFALFNCLNAVLLQKIYYNKEVFKFKDFPQRICVTYRERDNYNLSNFHLTI